MLMIAVALVASAIGAAKWMERRSSHFQRCALDYRDMAKMDEISAAISGSQAYKQLGAHRRMLQRKYERAARYPWLPVEPDPPQPK
jgi:hypothetical protein